MEQNARSLINEDVDEVNGLFIRQINVLTKKTIISIRKLTLFEQLGIDDATPKVGK